MDAEVTIMCRIHPWTTGVMVTAIATGTPLCALPCLVSVEPDLRVEFSSDSRAGLEPLVAETLGSVYRSIRSGTSAELSSPVEVLRDLPLTRYEQAHVHQADGHLWSERFEFELAIAAFERSRSLDALSRRDARNLDFNLGKLYRAVGSSQQGFDATLRWFDGAENPGSDEFYEVIAALWMEDRSEEALAWAELAKTSGAEGLSLEYQRAGLQLELGRTDELERDFHELVLREPEYASAVLDVISYGLTDDAARLRLMEFADSVDLLDGYQKVALAQLYRRMDRPYRAAVLMERALYDRAIEPDASRWLLLAESWLEVPDLGRAAEPLERAAELSGEPKLHERLGRLLLELRRWTAAEDALRKALAGGVRDARLLLFAALFSQTRFEDARKVLAPPEPPAPAPALRDRTRRL